MDAIVDLIAIAIAIVVVVVVIFLSRSLSHSRSLFIFNNLSFYYSIGPLGAAFHHACCIYECIQQTKC